MALHAHLKNTEPFSSLPEALLQEIAASVEEKTFAADTWIFREKQPATGFLYIIKKGLIEVSVMTPGGVEMVVDYRRDGGFFGGTPIFTGEPYAASVHAVKPTTCYLVPEAILRRAENASPQFSSYFTRIVLSRVRQLYAEIVAEHTTSSAFKDVEAFPFQKRLSEIMSPIVVCPLKASAQKIARKMIEKDISAVLVTKRTGETAGIVTESDLVRRVLAPEGIDATAVTADQIMTAHPYGMPPDTYMYEAMSYMLGHRIKHLPVIADDEAIGMVTLHDLMRYRSQKAMLLLGAVQEEKTIEGLATIRSELVTVARSLLSETRSTPEALEILTYIHHGIIGRAHDICYAQCVAEMGPAPDIRYCFLIMGSGGRREMSLNPDQDNAFVFENVSEVKLRQVEKFFAPFGEQLVEALARIGYSRCSGKVMVDNPAWRGRLIDWQHRVLGWAEEPEPINVRTSSIFFDFAPLAGDTSLAHDLRDTVNRVLDENPGFLFHMMTLDVHYKVPLGLLGRFLVEKGAPHKGLLSVKNGGTVFLVDCIRMFALEAGLHCTPTLKRLATLVEQGIFAADTAEHLEASFEALNYLRLRHEIALVEAGLPPDHYLDPQTLSKTEQDLLRESLQAVSKLQDAAGRHFGRRPF
jgi:CBS domain-containing protein